MLVVFRYLLIIIKVTKGKDCKWQGVSGVCTVVFQKVVIPNTLLLSQSWSLCLGERKTIV